MSEQGLFVTGRCKDILFVSGQNWYPQDIEQLLQQEIGVEAGKVAVSATRDDANAEDLLLVFMQYRRAPEQFVELVHRTRTVLTESTGLHAHAIVPVHTLPRTTSGKLQRFRLVQAYEAGEYAEVLDELQSSLDNVTGIAGANEVERQLLDICKRVFPDKHIGTDQNLFDLGADSLMLVMIHGDIEARFPGKVEVTDLFDYPTISSLAEHLQA